MFHRAALFAAAVASFHLPARAADVFTLVPQSGCVLIEIGVDEHGQITWDKVPLAGRVALEARLVEAKATNLRICFTLAPTQAGFSHAGPLLVLVQKYGFHIALVTKPSWD